MFDYIFYTLYKYYNEKEKGQSPIHTASMYVSFMQLLMIYFLFMMIDVFINLNYLRRSLNISDTSGYMFIVGLLLSLFTINYFRYKRKIRALESRFKNHPLNKKFKVWMIILIMAGLFILPPILRAYVIG